MGYIKEPKNVDFIIQSEPLTDKDRKDISDFIKDYKSKKLEIQPKPLREKRSFIRKEKTK